jgi:hypothetical protein
MERAAAVLVALLGIAVPAAAKDLAQSLLGKWEADKAAMAETMMQNAPKEMKSMPEAELRKKMEAEAPNVGFDFEEKRFLTSMRGQEGPVVPYTVVKAEGQTLWIDTEEMMDGKAQKEEFTLEFTDADTLRMKKKDDPFVLVLKRVK